jgi:hypothetical protein
MTKKTPARQPKKPRATRSEQPLDPLKLTRSLLRRRARRTALSEGARLKLFAVWIDAEPWAAGRLPAGQDFTDFSLVRLAAWLLDDEVSSVLSAVCETDRGAVERFASWVLRVTKADTAFFTTRRSGYVVNTYGPAHHRPAARLAQAVAASSETLRLPVPDELRVPEMPFLEMSPLSPTAEEERKAEEHEETPATTEHLESKAPGIWILLSHIYDWDVGICASSVPIASTFTAQAVARAAFHSHQAALGAEADLAIETVADGNYSTDGALTWSMFYCSFPSLTSRRPLRRNGTCWTICPNTSSMMDLIHFVTPVETPTLAQGISMTWRISYPRQRQRPPRPIVTLQAVNLPASRART